MLEGVHNPQQVPSSALDTVGEDSHRIDAGDHIKQKLSLQNTKNIKIYKAHIGQGIQCYNPVAFGHFFVSHDRSEAKR